MQKSQLRCFNFPKTCSQPLNIRLVQFAVNLHTNLSNMRGPCICLFTILFVCFSAKAQQTVFSGLPYDSTQTGAVKNTSIFLTSGNPLINTSVKTIPSSFYTSTLGFFCRKELQLEKALKFPVKFRLGSVAYTDKMEGKKTATSLQ